LTPQARPFMLTTETLGEYAVGKTHAHC